MTETYDLIVVGAGPGGYTAALAAARRGLRTAVIEKDALGGTCLNYGCIPTKTILQSAVLFWNTCHGADMGVCCDSVKMDWSKVYQYKNEVVAQLRAGIACRLEDCGVQVYDDEAVYAGTADAGAVGAEGGYASQTRMSGQPWHQVYLKHMKKVLTGKYLIIATGSTAAVPEMRISSGLWFSKSDAADGAMAQGRVMDSKTAMQYPPQNIKQLVIIGGGVIGIEFAFMYGSAGCKVAVLEMRSGILEGIDKDIVQRLKALLKKRGVRVVTDAKIQELCEDGNGGVICRYAVHGKLCAENADAVILAAGRRPESGGFFEDRSSKRESSDCQPGTEEAMINKKMSVAADAQGYILVDDCYETGTAGIYAIGDVIRGRGLAHEASAQALCVAHRIAGQCLGEDRYPAPDKAVKYIPLCIYTVPEIACVGLTEESAEAKGLSVSIRKYAMSANGKSVLTGNDRGFIKLVIDRNNHKILGAHLLCGSASDMITQFAQAMTHELTVEDMAAVIYPHPTYAEAIGEIVRR